MSRPTDVNIDNMSPLDFERYSLQFLSQQAKHLKDCRIEHNKIIKVDDGNYQIDGFIEFSIEGIEGIRYKTIIECKHYKSTISREKVQVLYDKIRACGAHKGVLISSSNYQSGAIEYAQKHGIALIKLTHKKTNELAIAAGTDALNGVAMVVVTGAAVSVPRSKVLGVIGKTVGRAIGILTANITTSDCPYIDIMFSCKGDEINCSYLNGQDLSLKFFLEKIDNS